MKSTAVADSLVVVVAMVTCARGQMTEQPCIPCTPQRCASTEMYVDCEASPPTATPCNNHLTGSVCVETAPSCVPCVLPPACRDKGKFCCPGGSNCFYECNEQLKPLITYCNGSMGCDEMNPGCPDPPTFPTRPPPPITTPSSCDEWTKWKKTPDPSNCHRYFKCKWQLKKGIHLTTKTCPFNMVFDETLLICKPDTDCGSRPRN